MMKIKVNSNRFVVISVVLRLLRILAVYVSIVNATSNKNIEQEQERECTTTTNTNATTTFLIKIGGSCISNKGKKETLNHEMLEWFSTTMEQIILHNKNITTNKYILVHGAGSFGHFTAKEYGIRSQTANPLPVVRNNLTYLMEGVAKTRLSVQTLNQHVLSSLIKEHNIPAIGISPLGFGVPCPASSEEDSSLFEESLRRSVTSALDAGLIPVLHGDACFYSDSSSSGSIVGAGILGGDVLLELLSKVLTDTKIKAIFVTDVPGIFTSNPKENPKTARLLSTIPIDPRSGLPLLEDILDASESSHKHDVTGGIAGKLKSATALVLQQTSIPVSIVQCGTTDAQRALQGYDDFRIGTRIVLASSTN